MHVDIPSEAKTYMTQFRWWQPEHSGPESDQWSLDQVIVGNYKDMLKMEDDFEVPLYGC